jgi:hypothetical protein
VNEKREIPRYGAPIRPKDRVRFSEWDGTVELIITRDSPDWEGYWKKFGEGVMLNGPAFGRVYTKFDADDLNFVSRP